MTEKNGSEALAEMDTRERSIESHQGDRDAEKNAAGSTGDAGAESSDEDFSAVFKKLSFFDKFLAIWILLAMAAGLLLGYFTETGEKLQQGEFIGVSIPIAIGLLVMMYPILCKIHYESLHLVLSLRAIWIHMAFSIILNWIIAPLFMLALAWAFLPDEPDLRAGLILVGIARCIAMVLIWTDLAGGDGTYCAILVAVNSILQIVLFAPLAVLFINVMSPSSATDSVEISYPLVAKSVGVFLGIPLGAAIITRFALVAIIGKKRYQDVFLKYLGPWSLIGLLFTIVVLFASQSKNVVDNIVSVVRVGAPLIVYFAVIFFATLFACRKLGRWGTTPSTSPEQAQRRLETWGYERSVTQSFTAASNNFELAIAVAVARYGPGSPQALAATVGPLIEVPVLLGLVSVARWARKRWQWR